MPSQGSSKTKVGIIGLGYRGQYLYRLIRSIDAFEVVAISDPAIHPEVRCQSIAYYNAPNGGHLEMLNNHELDLAIIASPWDYHIPQAKDCLKHGVHVALEIRGGKDIGEYEEIIRLSEAKHLNIFPLENTLFSRECLSIQRAICDGVFGEIISLSGGYRHDLRHLLTTNREHWRYSYYKQLNGDLYPTHGFAPVALWAKLSGGYNKVTRLSSIASCALGLSAYQDRKGVEPCPVATGDVVCTLIETSLGILIRLTHDTTLPRPKSLDYEVQGTRGIWQGEHRRIYIEGHSPHEIWEDDSEYIDKYEHPLWTLWGATARQIDAHHDGMDYIMLRWLAYTLNGGSCPYPATIHDLALWCSITPLSAKSLSLGQTISLRT